ncbi:MAG: hypothetical protein LBG69_05450 [Zoogloeaceae bacterium]|jgi:epoxyqueuosine reductase QueG|nr:hypothetical protein [Zoogloeaceae bacterium]
MNARGGYAAAAFETRAEEAPSAAVFADFLRYFVARDPRNHLPETLPDGERLRIWEAPLVGVAAADDPLFAALKAPDVVGAMHRSPAEWLPEAKSVIVWFLPYTAALRRGYPKKKDAMPSLEWVSGRRNGETFNNATRRAVLRFAQTLGGKGVAPSNEKDYRAVSMRPMWSERHAAYIAGLGTFGIHGALITEKGCAGRIGSVITDLELSPTPRPYRGIYDYCPYPAEGSRQSKCGACVPRCPVRAIAPEGRDNPRCVEHGRDTVGDYYRAWGYHSCGHCLTWLPCADRIPFRRQIARSEPAEH